ncbi:hypothetical protein CEXT_78331 [Caerostris extrusa]|uniref:Uncharacterized protein n=1 Tax=Caerostris extrusa TaxID=172846 RepID=A0AAV4RRK7_CAEEX|nr:hypothetical protein CEXT_78331 [Caerostris extrusa]
MILPLPEDPRKGESSKVMQILRRAYDVALFLLWKYLTLEEEIAKFFITGLAKKIDVPRTVVRVCKSVTEQFYFIIVVVVMDAP